MTLKFTSDNLQKLKTFVSSKIQYRETWKCVTIFDLNSRMPVPNMQFSCIPVTFKIYSFHWIKFVKYIKLNKLQCG